MLYQEQKDKRARMWGLLCIIGSIMMQLVMGTLFIWGAMSLYVTQYYGSKNDKGLTVSMANIVFPI